MIPLITKCNELQVGECLSRQGTYSLPALNGSGEATPVTLFEFALKMPKYPFLLLASAGDIQRSARTKTV